MILQDIKIEEVDENVVVFIRLCRVCICQSFSHVLEFHIDSLSQFGDPFVYWGSKTGAYRINDGGDDIRLVP